MIRQVATAYLPAALFFVAVLVVWQVATAAFSIPTFLLPDPVTIAEKVWSMRAMLLESLSTTMLSAVLGFLLGTVVAFLLGTLFVYSSAAERALLPWTIIIRTIPALAIAPLLTIWLGFGLAPKITLAAIAAFFPILINFHRGLASISREVSELLEVLDASRAQALFKVRLFAALPFAFAALKISSGAAVLAAIVAEFTGANRGIGTLIVSAGYQQDAPMLFSAILVSCLATIVFYYLIVILERVSLYWPDAQITAG
jgi:NitT/TauT family transport system permease protein